MRRLKMAEIRKNDENRCPFGLPIPFGCEHAGNFVEKMAPFEVMGKDVTEEEKQALSAANTKLLAWNLLYTTEIPTRCKYAAKVLEEHNAVECNQNDTAPGENTAQPILQAPFYSTMYNGIISGLMTYPIGYMSDYNVSKNAYFGIYSVQGNQLNILQKVAAAVVDSLDIRII